MKKVLRCLNCGYEKEILDDVPLDKRCAICGSTQLRAELSDEEDDKVAGYLNEEQVSNEKEKMTKEMIQSISEVGNDKTWQSIENIGEVNLRLKLRNIFFLVGGHLPIKEKQGDK